MPLPWFLCRPILTLTALSAAAPACSTPTAPTGPEATDRAATGPHHPPPTVRLAPHRFVTEAGDEVDAELGHLTVPERRGRPHGRDLELTFVRFPALPGASGPPIVYLAGGPGGSGIDAARGPRFAMFNALRAVGDVIALDQRGTGQSNAIPWCAAPRPWPLEVPAVRPVYTAWLQGLARHCAAWWRTQGVDLGGYTTVESADDLDDLRRALGAERLHLIGISYGTHLAMAAMRRHGAHLGRIVLASAEGPDDTIKRPQLTEAFLRRVLTADEHAALGQALARLAAAPARASFVDPRSATVGEVVTISKLDLQRVVGYLIKNPSSQRSCARGCRPSRRATSRPARAPLVEAASEAEGMRGMPEAMDAASGVSRARQAQVRREAPGTLLEDTLNYPGLDAGRGRSASPISATTFARPLRSDVPTLLLSGDRDGRTYVESHRELAATLARADPRRSSRALATICSWRRPRWSRASSRSWAGARSLPRRSSSRRDPRDRRGSVADRRLDQLGVGDHVEGDVAQRIDRRDRVAVGVAGGGQREGLAGGLAGVRVLEEERLGHPEVEGGPHRVASAGPVGVEGRAPAAAADVLGAAVRARRRALGPGRVTRVLDEVADRALLEGVQVDDRLVALAPVHVLEELRDRDRRQDPDDRHDDHQLDQREASAMVGEGRRWGVHF
jgi:pimeloyl-ACP methyl ester carboxylesterase